MCGICGIAGPGGCRKTIERMTKVIAHRGPDGCGIHEGNGIFLGHRRLSIIDLKTGDQPMSNEDGTIHIVFNGEIYNFQELRKQYKVQIPEEDYPKLASLSSCIEYLEPRMKSL